jgi:hypothetical protein
MGYINELSSSSSSSEQTLEENFGVGAKNQRSPNIVGACVWVIGTLGSEERNPARLANRRGRRPRRRGQCALPETLDRRAP